MSKNKLLYRIYNNLFEYISYRKLTTDDTIKPYDEFENEITSKNYIIINTNSIDKIILVYDDIILIKSNEIKKILKNIKMSDINHILITRTPISNLVLSSLSKTYKIKNYMYRLFTTIIPKHIFSNESQIMTKEEIDILTNKQLFSLVNKLLIIYVTDPMCIWLGAKIGDVIKIKRISETTIYGYVYRIVTQTPSE